MKRLVTLAVVFGTCVALVPSAVLAASFGLQPQSGNYTTGRTFTVTVFLNSADQAANAVSGDLTFPADIVQVANLSKTGSVVNLWVQEPNYSNTNGTIRFEGAILNPGFQGTGAKVLTITFRAVGGGAAQLRFGAAAILANDGLGTNIVGAIGQGSYAVTQSTVVAPTPPSQQPLPYGLSFDPGITSETHPAPTTWSSSPDARFAWHSPEGASVAQYGIDRASSSIPGTGSSDLVSGVTLPLTGFPDDGAYFFHLRFRLGEKWSPTYHRKILVDRVPPESFEVSQIQSSDQTSPRPELRVDATDTQSGLDHIEVFWDGGQLRVPATASTRFLMPALPPGTQALNVRIVDRAGNGRVSRVYVHIEPIAQPIIQEFTPRVGKEWPWSAEQSETTGMGEISGTATQGEDVIVTFSKSDSPNKEVIAHVDDSGRWSATYPSLYEGIWTVKAVARDARGATSMPTDAVSVRSGSNIPRFVWILPWFLVVILLGVVFWALRRRKNQYVEVPLVQS